MNSDFVASIDGVTLAIYTPETGTQHLCYIFILYAHGITDTHQQPAGCEKVDLLGSIQKKNKSKDHSRIKKERETPWPVMR